MALSDSTQSWRWGNPSLLHAEVTNQVVKVEAGCRLLIPNVDGADAAINAHEIKYAGGFALGMHNLTPNGALSRLFQVPTGVFCPSFF